MPSHILFDEKCLELAKHFLADTLGAKEEDACELAESLQVLCEDFCRDIEEKFDGLGQPSIDDAVEYWRERERR